LLISDDDLLLSKDLFNSIGLLTSKDLSLFNDFGPVLESQAIECCLSRTPLCLNLQVI
jgi:hypothetical protein